MKNLTLFSFYRSNNIGDLLIADKVSKLFGSYYDCSLCDIGNFEEIELDEWQKNAFGELSLTSSLPVGIKKAVLDIELFRSIIGEVKSHRKEKIARALDNCRDSEVVVFAGGNSLMELGYLPTTLKTFYNLISALKNEGKKVAFCFCGVGPFRTVASFREFGKIIRLLDFISVRDDASLELVKRAYPEATVEVWRDPVLLTERERDEIHTLDFGVNVYFGHNGDRNADMKQAFVLLVGELRKRFPERKVILFSSELTDIGNIASVKEAFADDEKVEARRVRSIDELFTLYCDVACVLGTRMHTLITAIVAHKAVASISWQSKVTALMEYFSSDDLNFTTEDFIEDPVGVADALEDIFKRREEIVTANDEILKNTRASVDESLKIFKERF